MSQSLINSGDKILKCMASAQNGFFCCFFGIRKANVNVFWRHLASRKVDRALV